VDGGFVGGPYVARAKVLAWTFEYWEDIASDLAVFHRIDDPNTLSIAVFLSKATRLPAYSGALKVRFATPQTAGMASTAGVPTGGAPTAAGGRSSPPGTTPTRPRSSGMTRRSTGSW
jgi:hypothetical protein